MQICCPSVCLSVRPVRPFVRPCRSTVRIYVRTYVRTYTYVPARHFRAEYKRVYVYASTYADMYKCAAGTGTYGSTYLRIITYKRVILSYTPALLMIIKTPRSILFALEYFLKFSPGITAPSACPAPRHPRTALHHHPHFSPSSLPYIFANRRNVPRRRAASMRIENPLIERGTSLVSLRPECIIP